MAARIHEGDGGVYFYEVDDIDIPLTEDSFQAFEHRWADKHLIDWIGVLDPRDNEHFSHWRYDQPPEVFDEMMALCKRIGTVVIRNSPYDYIQSMFDARYGLGEHEIEEFFGEAE